ncbi:PQQ-dependent catabolism-associated CXXCW motif protein [Hyphomicrobium sp.]|uniref:PQQ-dependent catabolism-associated CXXCW motif protein n=1 Tax=Hyphomicrobium sp. TaxID=82 RepID=UPI000FA3DE95|nr:PQQ-dependent catabolism-associated CXXCW motif protein [Hyphomicrobium sp.]RUO97488.1 MAG: PQQ-dependent catabolism-associated CXXCW motif protein [Hyphomicrobium sp.]
MSSTHHRPTGLAKLLFFVALLTSGLAGIANAEDVSGPSPSGPPPPEPQAYRTDLYRSPVPLTLKGAKVLSAEEAMKLWSTKQALFIDVYPHPPKPAGLPAGTIWRESSHMTIEDAVWLPNVGYGALSAEYDAYFRRSLAALTHGDLSKPLVFFCLRNCWMSWNAAKRALSYGYSNVSWFRDGTDGWQETGGLTVDAHPMK